MATIRVEALPGPPGQPGEIRFQGFRYICAGYLVELWLYDRVTNKVVKAWRQADPGLSVRKDDSVPGGLAGNG
jgi:hypothetical protein